MIPASAPSRVRSPADVCHILLPLLLSSASRRRPRTSPHRRPRAGSEWSAPDVRSCPDCTAPPIARGAAKRIGDGLRRPLVRGCGAAVADCPLPVQGVYWRHEPSNCVPAAAFREGAGVAVQAHGEACRGGDHGRRRGVRPARTGSCQVPLQTLTLPRERVRRLRARRRRARLPACRQDRPRGGGRCRRAPAGFGKCRSRGSARGWRPGRGRRG